MYRTFHGVHYAETLHQVLLVYIYRGKEIIFSFLKILYCTVSEDGEDEEEEYEEEEQVPLPDGTMPPPKKRKRKAKKGRRSKLSNKKQDFQVSCAAHCCLFGVILQLHTKRCNSVTLLFLWSGEQFI